MPGQLGFFDLSDRYEALSEEGNLFAFRGRAGSPAKIIGHDGIGMSLCLYEWEGSLTHIINLREGGMCLSSIATLISPWNRQGPATFTKEAKDKSDVS